jgi:tRNA modification GTPase
VRGQLRAILDAGRQGERIRSGLTVVILGAPNAGKSSLLNALAKRDVAIVSHLAGTTRDAIEVQLDIAGLPVAFVDTAGIHESRDAIEQEGIRRALARAADADLKLLLLDATAPDAGMLALADAQTLVVANKADQAPTPGHLAISALTGQGLETLLAALAERLGALTASAEPPLITRERHRVALETALGHVERVALDAPIELNCEELRRAAVEIGKITGKIHVDALLDRIFAEFCIGK